ncbi:MAG TPA: MBL fold metallo-hydrolase [Porticoccaceae bacterium]|jgi:glyoxylase-like metal-dependent hydrolase (beta-lactamase superfamily II)|nr:MBL fold metallo-hydrolase [Gammaproteobacteria bacterium]HIL60706.1 MBL fold metallo-hydrolase [Porticoccaceae bacterium]
MRRDQMLNLLKMKSFQLLTMVLLSGFFGSLAFAQAQDPLSIEQVKNGLYIIIGSGGNVGVRVTNAGVILIDDKYPQNFDEIQSLVASVSDLPVRYVINTHHHGDHSGGNAGYIQIAEIIAHKNARENMIRGGQDAPPRIIYTEETAVYLGDVEVQAFYMGRGHTNGDTVVYFPDLKTVHGGDLLHSIAPFIDYSNGGSSRGWVATMNNILSLDFDTAIPGHGMIMDRRDVLDFRNQMEAVRARMTGLVRGGLQSSDAADEIRDGDLSWTQADNGLFMRRSIPGFYEEISAELSQ